MGAILRWLPTMRCGALTAYRMGEMPMGNARAVPNREKYRPGQSAIWPILIPCPCQVLSRGFVIRRDSDWLRDNFTID
jgi:hypothetical protein